MSDVIVALPNSRKSKGKKSEEKGDKSARPPPRGPSAATAASRGQSHGGASSAVSNTLAGSQYTRDSSRTRKVSRWTWLRHIVLDPFRAINNRLMFANARMERISRDPRASKEVVESVFRALRKASKLIKVIQEDLGQVTVQKITFKQLAELKLINAGCSRKDSNKSKDEMQPPSLTAVASFIKEEFVTHKVEVENIEELNLQATMARRMKLEPWFKSFADWAPKLGIECPDVKELKALLRTIGSDWAFDVFRLDVLTGGRPLYAAMYTIFNDRRILQTFHIPRDVFDTFATRVEAACGDHRFHNRIHAADVLVNAHQLLAAPCLQREVTEIEVLATLVAAAAGSLDHPGLNNVYHIRDNSQRASQYNDESINEQHSLDVVLSFLQHDSCDITQNLDRQDRRVFYTLLKTLIVDLDVSRQLNIITYMGLLNQVKSDIDDDFRGPAGDKAPRFLPCFLEQRKTLFSAVLVCADRAYPSKVETLYYEWKARSKDENFSQGDFELSRGLQVSPMCDRNNTNYDVFELSNISFVVMPVWQVFTELTEPFASEYYDSIVEFRSMYESKNINQRISMVNPYGIPTKDTIRRRGSQDSRKNSSCRSSARKSIFFA